MTSNPLAPARPSTRFSGPLRSGAIAAGCLLLAGCSLLVPSALTTDPWGWVVWGREILHLELSTVVPGAPSWKPLPVLATTPLALAGDAAPALWLVVARAGAFASLVVAYRLAARLAGRWAGAVAVLGLVLSSDWLAAFAHGYSEPLAIGLLLAAVDANLSDRPRRALLLGAGVALARPEAWGFLVLYGAMLMWRRRTSPWLPLGLTLVVPALWLVPDWIGSGSPFHGSEVSHNVLPSGAGAAFTAFGEAALIVPAPLSVAALAGVAIAARRGDRAYLDIAALAGAWTALLVILMLGGYPVSSRFFVLPAALVSVLGAVGAVRVVLAPSTRRARTVLTVALAVAAAPVVAYRAEATYDEACASVARARLESDLRTAVERSETRLRKAGTPVYPSRLGWAKGAIAWELGLPLRRVRAVRTSGKHDLEQLSEPGDRPLPRLPPRAALRTRRHHFVLFSPFGDARLSVAGRPRVRFAVLASAGRWRVEVPERAR